MLSGISFPVAMFEFIIKTSCAREKWMVIKPFVKLIQVILGTNPGIVQQTKENALNV